jgi:hypothetical protein
VLNSSGAGADEIRPAATSAPGGSVLVNEQEGTPLMKTPTIRAAFALAALVVAATACGDDDESVADASATAEAEAAGDDAAATPTTAAADDAVATTAAAEPTDAPSGGGGSLAVALADNMMEEAATGGSPVTSREEADCWANGIVDGIGEGRLGEMGVTPDAIGEIDELPLTDDEVSVVVDSLFECVDVQQSFADQFAGDFGQEAADCFAAELDADLLKEILGAQLAGGEASEEAFAAFQEIATTCGIGG